MLSQVRPAVVSLLLLTFLTGVLYPLAVTGVARIVFANRAAGSLIVVDGKAIGSGLIGQPFSDPKYFWPRPSATAPVPYAAQAGAGSNLGPTNPALEYAVRDRAAALRAADPQNARPKNARPIPIDLVTASGSGLDPHISVAAAEYQVGRVARARHLPEADVQQAVMRHTQWRIAGVLGEPRVHVLRLNLDLDRPALPTVATRSAGGRPILYRGRGFLPEHR